MINRNHSLALLDTTSLNGMTFQEKKERPAQHLVEEIGPSQGIFFKRLCNREGPDQVTFSNVKPHPSLQREYSQPLFTRRKEEWGK